jgi:hypothetical protein
MARLALLLLAFAGLAAASPFGQKFAGDGTYYGSRQRGFGHCSFHFQDFGNSPGYPGTPLAINAAQYTGTSVCGLCVRFRGLGSGLGGNPISQNWQPGFIWCARRVGGEGQALGGIRAAAAAPAPGRSRRCQPAPRPGPSADAAPFHPPLSACAAPQRPVP